MDATYRPNTHQKVAMQKVLHMTPFLLFLWRKKGMDDKKKRASDTIFAYFKEWCNSWQPKKLNTHLSSQENHTFLKHLTSSMLSSFLSILHKVHTQERINYFLKVLSVDLKLKFTNVSCRYSCWTLGVLFTMARQLRKDLGSSSSLEWNSERRICTWSLHEHLKLVHFAIAHYHIR